MNGPVLVTGGTGTLGRHLVPRLRQTGASVRVLSRRSHESADGVEFVIGNLDSDQGLDSALEGVRTIVHCAGSAKGDEQKTRSLVQAGLRAGVEHLVFISVVGADQVPVRSAIDRAMFGYYASKRGAEQVVSSSGLPWTTLRATQFHDLILTVARTMAKLPIIPIPAGLRFQPVDADDVAVRLVELALAQPAGLVPDIAGPRVYTVKELMHSYLHAVHRNRLVLSIPLPGQAARALRDGANLAPDRDVGHRTWEEFLVANVP